MIEPLLQLIELLGRNPEGQLPRPDATLLADVRDALAGLPDPPLGGLSSADPTLPESIVPALVQVHLYLEELTSPLLDLHGEVKRLLIEYPQIEE